MRRAAVFVVVLLVGCGERRRHAGDDAPATKKEPPVIRHESPPRPEPPAPPKAAPKVSPPVELPVSWDAEWTAVWDAYKKNQIAADATYRGKRGKLRVNRLNPARAGRTDTGVAYAAIDVIDQGAEPSVFLYFPKDAESGLATIRTGRPYVIDCVCVGRRTDHERYVRGVKMAGYNWRLEFKDCRVADYSPAR